MKISKKINEKNEKVYVSDEVASLSFEWRSQLLKREGNKFQRLEAERKEQISQQPTLVPNGHIKVKNAVISLHSSM